MNLFHILSELVKIYRRLAVVYMAMQWLVIVIILVTALAAWSSSNLRLAPPTDHKSPEKSGHSFWMEGYRFFGPR